MAYIWYGVSGDGSGHGIRSREVIRFLRARGHRVQAITYGRALTLLSEEISCQPIAGLQIVYKHNRLQFWRSFFHCLAYIAKSPASCKKLKTRLKQERPDLIISDFEPLTSQMARQHRIPLISFDNIHRLVFRADAPVWREYPAWYLARFMIWLFSAPANAYLVMAFGPVRLRKASQPVEVVPPIIRPSVLALEGERGEHLLIYSSFADKRLPQLLKRLDRPCVVYGFDRDAQEGKIHFKKFNEHDYFEDLRTCRAIIGTAGFTLITEALTLRKPYLAMPVMGQFEQMENAHLLKELGYGEVTVSLDIRIFEHFLAHLEQYEAALTHYQYPGNEPALAALVSTAQVLGIVL